MSRDSSRTYIHLHSPHHADLFEHFTNPHLSSGMAMSSGGVGSSATFGGGGHAGVAGPATHPVSSSSSSSSALAAVAHQSLLASATVLAGQHSSLPHEDIAVAAHLEPPNPEDEDDVVPDQHAAFGITRAMAGREGRERAWRDFEGLRALVRGDHLAEGNRTTNGGASTTRTMLPR